MRRLQTLVFVAVVITAVTACAILVVRRPPSREPTRSIPAGVHRGLDFVEMPSRGITPASRFVLKGTGVGTVVGHVTEETTYAVEGVGVALRQFEGAMASAPPYRIDVYVPRRGVIAGVSVRMKTPWKRSE